VAAKAPTVGRSIDTDLHTSLYLLAKGSLPQGLPQLVLANALAPHSVLLSLLLLPTPSCPAARIDSAVVRRGSRRPPCKSESVRYVYVEFSMSLTSVVTSCVCPSARSNDLGFGPSAGVARLQSVVASSARFDTHTIRGLLPPDNSRLQRTLIRQPRCFSIPIDLSIFPGRKPYPQQRPHTERRRTKYLGTDGAGGSLDYFKGTFPCFAQFEGRSSRRLGD
jgi:hypothetical protein